MRRLSFVLALLGLASLLAAPCARAQAPAILDRFRGRLGLCQTPGQPALLTVSVVGEGSLRLAWGSAAGVETAAQPDCSLTAYELSVAVGGRAAGTTKTFTTTVPTAIINGLSASERYTVTVRARNSCGASAPATRSGLRPSVAAGAAASATAGSRTPAGQGWQCVARAGYPVCSAGKAGLCTPISCADMARLSRCTAPYLRVQDWEARTITQHCAAECGGCGVGGAAPQLAAAESLAPPQQYCCAYGSGAYFAGPGGAAVPNAASAQL